jgi:alpha-tubulin suppressor-like RCC1 family protein
VTAHETSTCALLANGHVRCWGAINGASSPSEVAIEGAIAIAEGSRFACGLLSNGRVACFGFNHFKQLGADSPEVRTTAEHVPGLSNVVEIAAGDYHACARNKDGDVFCWGSNTLGTLGNGTSSRRMIPERVAPIEK